MFKINCYMKILIIKPASETIFYIRLTFLGFSKCCNFFVFKYFLDWKKVLKSWEANSFIYPENVTCPYGYHNKNYIHSYWNLEIEKYVENYIFLNFQISVTVYAFFVTVPGRNSDIFRINERISLSAFHNFFPI